MPRSCRGLVWHVGRACKTGLGDRRRGAGAGVPCVAVAVSHFGETLPILFCVLVLFCTTAILNVPGGPGLGLTRRGCPRVCGPAVSTPVVWALGGLCGRPRGPPRARTTFLPSLYHAFVFLRGIAYRSTPLPCELDLDDELRTPATRGLPRSTVTYLLRLTDVFALYSSIL